MARGVELVEAAEEGVPSFGVREGAEVRYGDPLWVRVQPGINSVLECHLGSSSLGLLEEEWFAVLIGSIEKDSKDGLYIEGELLGCEDPDQLEFVETHLQKGPLHLCNEEICGEEGKDGDESVHVRRVRCWSVKNFKADYLTAEGKKLLKQAKGDEKKKALGTARSKAKPVPKDNKERVAGKKRKTKKVAKAGDVISLDSEDSVKEKGGDGEKKGAGMSHAALKELFRGAKDRMTQGVTGRGQKGESEDSSGGRKPRASKPARAEKKIISGTNFKPGKMTPLAIENSPAIRDGGLSKLSEKMKKSRDPGDLLLAQAAQQLGPQTGRGKKRKKDKKDERKVIDILKKAVGDKKKKKKGKKKGKKRKVKRDPDDPDGSDGSSSSSDSSSSSSQEGEEGGESDSDLSYEPPLRKKALTSPGSVLKDLIKHAQEQMDKGALMDHEGQPASLTSGVKLSTYFALLIRPYFPNNNPLLRELYQLAQSIDLLRLGRLAETGDALASRFVAVHTAMTDGNWQVAAQLELYPLEQVQSTTTSTMLQAQRHRRLLWKAQGFSSRVYGKGRGGWMRGNGGDEKGFEKGWKGKGKGRGKGKNQGQQDHKGSWGNSGGKDGANPWKENKEEMNKKA